MGIRLLPGSVEIIKSRRGGKEEVDLGALVWALQGVDLGVGWV